jgi:rhodanese-related sulfurtransferase
MRARILFLAVGLLALSVLAVAQHGGGDGVHRISPAQLREAVLNGKAVIVDVRGADSYSAGHIKGARLIPVNEIEARAGELPRNKMIVTYCS